MGGLYICIVDKLVSEVCFMSNGCWILTAAVTEWDQSACWPGNTVRLSRWKQVLHEAGGIQKGVKG